MLKSISFVVPIYNEEESIGKLYKKLISLINRDLVKSRVEMIFINDGSTDNSLKILTEISDKDRLVKIISFKVNNGKGMALQQGFNNATGDVIVTLDADLQDDPENIPKLIDKLKGGFDLVVGWKKKRRDKISKILASKFFNLLVSFAAGIKLNDFNSGLKAIKKEAVLGLDVSGGRYRFLPMLVYKQGFKVCEIPVTHYPRKYGRSKYGKERFIPALIDLFKISRQLK